MKKQKITDTISVAEMLHMRNVDGMSNKEIAQRIGCAISTVIDHIGRQPREMTLKARSAGMRKFKHEEPSTPVGEPTKPHESFADLVARVKAEAAIEKNKKELGLEPTNTKPEPESMKAVALEEPDNQAKPEPLTDDLVFVRVHGTMYKIPRCAYEVIKNEVFKMVKHDEPAEPLTANQERNTNDELHALVEELKVMFSPLSALDYLKCKLYELGTPHIIYADREAYLTEIHRLLCMQEGAAQHD